MKTGILTLPLHTNYGGILQAYALQTVLTRMGHDAYVIEKEQKPLRLPLWRMPVKFARRIIRNLTGHPYPIFYEWKQNRELPIIRQHTDKFIRKHVRRMTFADYNSISEKDFDAIVVGSDQVWRPQYFDDIRTAYLDFAEGWDIKRMAYAASFGTDKWEYTQRREKECGRLLRMFDAVSVREASGVDLCRKHFGVEAQHVLDPTMLLNIQDYISLFADSETPMSKGTLLNYILDDTPEKTALTAAVAEKKGLVPFRVNSKVENINAPLNERIQPPVEQWLRGFYDAEFVITDSFHACVFSIIFNKPFLAVGNQGRGMSRFKSLLAMFGLDDRLIMPDDLHSGAALEASAMNIDWDDVNNRLAHYKEQSTDFLKRL